MNRTADNLVRELGAQGCHLYLDGEDRIRILGNPSPLLVDEVRERKPELLHRLRRSRALELASIINGPGSYGEKMRSWPEYAALVKKITEHDGGTSCLS
jgi:hypothetical protein